MVGVRDEFKIKQISYAGTTTEDASEKGSKANVKCSECDGLYTVQMASFHAKPISRQQ